MPQPLSPSRAAALLQESAAAQRSSLEIQPAAAAPAQSEAGGHSGDEGSARDDDDASEDSDVPHARSPHVYEQPRTPAPAKSGDKRSDKQSGGTQSRAILIMKLVLGTFLLVAAAVLSGFSYALLHNYQQTQFEEAFSTFVTTVHQSLSTGFANKQQAAAVAAAHVAALVGALQLPPSRSFEASAMHASIASLNATLNGLAESRGFMWAPLVYAPYIGDFNTFAAGVVPAFEGAGDVAVALSQHGTWSLPQSGNASAPAPLNTQSPFYVPILQIVPFAPTQQYVLLDLLTFDGVRDAVSAALHQLTPQLTDMLKLSDSLSDDTSIMFTPVLAGGSLVGFTGVIFSWADMAFSGLLDSGARGVLGEVRSPRGLTQMFRLLSEGRLEEGDAFSRDSQFDRYRVDLAGFFGAEWRVSLWPTAELYDAYVTQTPVICAVVVALLVLFVCCIFGVYDYLAATRAELLKRMWHATEAVVADVFPNAVKSRLVQEQLRRHRITSSGHSGSVKPSASNSKRRPAVRSGKTKPMRRMFNQAAQAVSSALSRDDDDDDDDGAAYGGFIADAYAAATVVFADIVGFTEWSASVPPTEVFRVLEAVFGEFDALAKSLGVFKVETIGDCYMACCGCPDAYEDHAARAADFALGLADGFKRAGEATGVTHLCCRVGLHSGPVVAGVLRAEKHRFQLFGDTVNTASRMESTGEPKKVQCSADTAALLLNSGRHMLRRRGVIAVKGKGSFETYWLTGRVTRSRPPSSRSFSTPQTAEGADGTGSRRISSGSVGSAAGAASVAEDAVRVVIDADDVTIDTSQPAAGAVPPRPPRDKPGARHDE